MGRDGAEGRLGLMCFLSPCSTTASRTATTPAMLPCSGPKVGSLGLWEEGEGGSGLPSLSEVHPSVCSPSCGEADSALALFQGSAGEELRATLSSKPQVGASPRSSPPASGWVGWPGLSPPRQAGKAGVPQHLSGLAVPPSPHAGAREQPSGCQLLLSASPKRPSAPTWLQQQTPKAFALWPVGKDRVCATAPLGMSLLPVPPNFIRPSLPSLSRSDSPGSQHSPKTAQTHRNRHAFLFLIHSVLD